MSTPDFVFILDTPSKLTFSKLTKRAVEKGKSENNKFEENTEFLEKVRQNYLKKLSFFQNKK